MSVAPRLATESFWGILKTKLALYFWTRAGAGDLHADARL